MIKEKFKLHYFLQWDSILVIFLSLLTGFFVYFPLTNTDIWWHLAGAREMMTRRGFLYTDPFSYTHPEASWINLHWLFQIGAYGIFKAWGVTGLVIGKCCIIMGTSFLLSYTFNDRKSRLGTALIFSLLIFEARYLVLARPILITMVALALYIYFFEKSQSSTNHTKLLWLIPIQIVWTNSQGLFILGPVIAGCYFLGTCFTRIHNSIRRKKLKESVKDTKGNTPDHCFLLGLTWILLISSSLINPYGWRGLMFPLSIYNRINPTYANIYAHNVSENIPLFHLRGHDLHYIFWIMAITCLALFLLWINRSVIKWSHLLLGLAFLYLAIIAKRNILLYFIVIAPLIGHNISLVFSSSSGTVQKLIKKWPKGKYLGLLLSLMILFVTGIYHTRIVKKYPRWGEISPFRVPTGAVRFLQSHPLPGKMFNSIRYGGYLLWNLYPEHQVFIDGRLIIRSPQFFHRYLNLIGAREDFSLFSQGKDIAYVILPSTIFYECKPLIQWLYQAAQWDLIYTDGESVIFARQGYHQYLPLDIGNPDHRELIEKRIDQIWHKEPGIRLEAHSYFNNFCQWVLEQPGT